MQLYQALAVRRGDIISFVGAGGKTTAMYRLGHELVGLGWRVVTTTTTLIRPPAPEQSGMTVIAAAPERLLQSLEQAIRKHKCITVASGQTKDAKAKLKGVDPQIVAQIAKMPGVDAVLVEADGARGRLIKAPGPHEPPVPSSTSLLVPVMAANAIGQPLDESIAHRPERISALTGLQMGSLITPEIAAAVLTHPEGGLKNAGEVATVCPLINKVESDGALVAAQQVARNLITSPRVTRILLSSLSEPNPMVECWSRMTAVILAAGESRRMGRPKQLIDWKGKTMLEAVVSAALASEIQEVIAVLGFRAKKIQAALKGYHVKTVVNSEWSSGISTSIRAGLQSLGPQTEACLFLLGDQPMVTSQLIDSLITRHRRTLAPIIVAAYRGRRGNPVLFSRALFPELVALEGEQGGRSVIEKHQAEVEWMEVDSEGYFLDIDTTEDLDAAAQ